jgi:hypothetical protein
MLMAPVGLSLFRSVAIAWAVRLILPFYTSIEVIFCGFSSSKRPLMITLEFNTYTGSDMSTYGRL